MHIHAGPWSQATFGAVGSSGFVRLGDLTAERFADLGVTLKAGNRLDCARQVAIDLDARRLVVAPDDPATAALTSEAIRTVWEFSLVARTAPAHHPPTVAKLEEMVTFTLLPGDDKNQHGRDMQFELYVATLFAMGGVPIRGEEPDLRFLLDGAERGLSAVLGYPECCEVEHGMPRTVGENGIKRAGICKVSHYQSDTGRNRSAMAGA